MPTLLYGMTFTRSWGSEWVRSPDGRMCRLNRAPQTPCTGRFLQVAEYLPHIQRHTHFLICSHQWGFI